MSLLTGAEDKRHVHAPEGKEFVLTAADGSAPRTLTTLDELSEAISMIDPETFRAHVNEEKNDFANWVDYVFEEKELAEDLRQYPTPLRMMVTIEKFLRKSQVHK